jgi:hypothetical protein
MCGKKVERLFNGRCIACETKVAQAIFHHQTPKPDLEVKRLPKKREQ